MKLSLVKAVYSDALRSFYSHSEIELFFYIALEYLEKKSKTHVLLGEETFMVESYLNILEELKKGKPIQYILEVAPFFSLDFFVNESVLIPRPETEELVQWIIDEHAPDNRSICDIGTGSGCIAIALKKHLKSAAISGCDISEEALKVARRNSKQLDADVTFFQCDVLNEAIPNAFDILVSNPPYITTSEKAAMEQNVLDFEPHLALFVEEKDPLIFYRSIIEKRGMARLIFFEISQSQNDSLVTYLNSVNCEYIFRNDLNGNPRLLRIQFPS